MFNSHITVIASSRNADQNSIQQIADAMQMFGATEIEVTESGVIEAWVPQPMISDILLIEGVSYVRSDMSYQAA